MSTLKQWHDLSVMFPALGAVPRQWDHHVQPCLMPGRCHGLLPQVCNGEGVWHLFLVLDNICSHPSARSTMTHCVSINSSMQGVITIIFSTERLLCANQAWFCKSMMFSSRDRWRYCGVGYLLPASRVNWLWPLCGDQVQQQIWPQGV